MNLEVLSKLTKCLLSTDSRKGNLRLENGGGGLRRGRRVMVVLLLMANYARDRSKIYLS